MTATHIAHSAKGLQSRPLCLIERRGSVGLFEEINQPGRPLIVCPITADYVQPFNIGD